jgi:hypothetical protein
MGFKLTAADERLHTVGTAANWNESRYIDFWDSKQRIGGWLRIGNRPNEGHGEVSACIYLPDGSLAFGFERAKLSANTLQSGGQSWEIVEPWHETRVRHRGEMLTLADPWTLKDPKQAFATAPRQPADIDLTVNMFGPDEVMGSDQDHIDRIFVPGQADFHYQHLIRVSGTVKIGSQSWTVNGRGGKDHSWGPRNWHAKIYLRWNICAFDDRNGFMLVRAVGPTKQTRGGFLLEDGQFHLVDGFDMRNDFAGGPNYELQRMHLAIRAGDRQLNAVGTAQAYVPLRHLKRDANGDAVLLRMVKSPMEWVDGAGQRGVGHCEIQDTVIDGKPVGLND